MMRKAFQLSFLLAALSAASADAATLREVRLTTAENVTRVVLELSDVTGHELFTLEDPHRVVIDLDDAVEAPGFVLPKASGPVAAMRTGAQADGSLRFVIETSAKTPADAAWAGGRLTITLGGETREPRVVRAAHAPPDTGRA